MLETWYSFTNAKDERGALVAAEGRKQIPFSIERVYFVYGVGSGVVRGNHAHWDTRQVLVAIQGSCRFTLNDGKQKETILLNDPAKGLLVDCHIWHNMFYFTPGTVLMAFASSHYDEADYVRNYDEFLRCVQSGWVR